MKNLEIKTAQRTAETTTRKSERIYGVFLNRDGGNSWIQTGFAFGDGRVYEGGDPDYEVKVIFEHPSVLWGSIEEIENDFNTIATNEIIK